VPHNVRRGGAHARGALGKGGSRTAAEQLHGCGRAGAGLVWAGCTRAGLHAQARPLRSAQVRSRPLRSAHCAHTVRAHTRTVCTTLRVRVCDEHCAHIVCTLLCGAPLTVVSHGAHERSTKSVVRAQGVHEQQARESVGVPRRQGQHALQADRRCYFVRGGWGVVCPTNKHVACGTGLHSAAVGTPQLPGFVLLGFGSSSSYTKPLYNERYRSNAMLRE
jgi:hypothetical protein